MNKCVYILCLDEKSNLQIDRNKEICVVVDKLVENITDTVFCDSDFLM